MRLFKRSRHPVFRTDQTLRLSNMGIWINGLDVWIKSDTHVHVAVVVNEGKPPSLYVNGECMFDGKSFSQAKDYHGYHMTHSLPNQHWLKAKL